MISLKQRNKGFTIVELLIVIVVIGILALLVITTYSGIQSKARNGKRQTDIQSIQTQLEAFYSQNGFYPSRVDVNTASWRTTNMKSLDAQALIDPSNPTQAISGFTTAANGPLVNGAVAKSYSYVAKESDGTTDCTAGDTNCASYTLVATYEGTVNGSTTYQKVNLD